jgi:hypothetical protein
MAQHHEVMVIYGEAGDRPIGKRDTHLARLLVLDIGQQTARQDHAAQQNRKRGIADS